MDINWDSNIFVFGVEQPTYGHYGGIYHSNWGQAPIDTLDTLFMYHDASSGGIAADHALLWGMVWLNDSQLDAEGSLYAGLAELAMVGELMREGYWFSPFELAYVTHDAIHNIQNGLAGLDPAETSLALNWAAQSAWGLLV